MIRPFPRCSRKLKARVAFGLATLTALAAHAQAPREAQSARDAQPVSASLDAGAESLGDLLRESEAAAPETLNAADPVAIVPGAGPGSRGRWRATPHLDMRATYDDNIFIRHRDRTDDFIFALSPGVALGYWESNEDRERYLDKERAASVVQPGQGNFCLVDYTATLLGFAKTHSQNAFDQDGLITGRRGWEKLVLSGTVHLESKSETNTEVGGRIRRRTETGELTSTYQATEKTAVGLAFYDRLNDPKDFVQTLEWRTEAFVDYAATPLVRVGISAGAGFVNVESGADQVFERVLARASYALSEKLEAGLRAGVEFRQSSGSAGDRTNPIFELEATWTPAAETKVSVQAFRRVETSIERPEQNITFTGCALRLRRQLRHGFHGILEGGYEFSDYTSTPTESGRNDSYYFVRPSLLYNFAAWGNASLSYEHRANDSSQGSSSFFDNQTSLQISLVY
jgi:hypothetical protein